MLKKRNDIAYGTVQLLSLTVSFFAQIPRIPEPFHYCFQCLGFSSLGTCQKIFTTARKGCSALWLVTSCSMYLRPLRPAILDPSIQHGSTTMAGMTSAGTLSKTNCCIILLDGVCNSNISRDLEHNVLFDLMIYHIWQVLYKLSQYHTFHAIK